MISRVRFVLGAAAVAAGLPSVVRAQAASPAPSPAPDGGVVLLESNGKRHVHGSNGLTRIPEHRVIEWKMQVLDGPDFRLSAYRDLAVFVNVFATWCPPCRAEQPMVVDFAKAHGGDTAVIGIDVHEEDNDVRAYRKKFAIPYPIAMHRNHWSLPGIFVKDEFIYPTTLVFKPDGTLSCAWEGDRDREWWEAEREHALS